MKDLPKLKTEDAKKLSRLLSAEELFPILNDTKWLELIGEMLEAPEGMAPKFRTRSVFASKGFMTEWDGEWYYHIHPVAELEWVELQASSEDWLCDILRKHNIPFTIENGVPRVWGYTRPGIQPIWE